MGEIRSTLDIIMEKTKGLTMSEDEKAELQHREMAGKIKGLILKFFDGVIDLDRLRIEAAAIKGESQQMFDQLIKEELINRIELEGNNAPVFAVLEGVTGTDTAPIREILIDFQRRLERERDLAEGSLKEILHEKAIWGSAVSPNLDADPEWRDYVSKLNRTFREEVEN
jgi:hypothetical protein